MRIITLSNVSQNFVNALYWMCSIYKNTKFLCPILEPYISKIHEIKYQILEEPKLHIPSKWCDKIPSVICLESAKNNNEYIININVENLVLLYIVSGGIGGTHGIRKYTDLIHERLFHKLSHVTGARFRCKII